jgi:hypothetical protein
LNWCGRILTRLDYQSIDNSDQSIRYDRDFPYHQIYFALRTAVKEYTENGNKSQLSEISHSTEIIRWQPSNEIVRQFEIENPNKKIIIIIINKLE